MSPDELTAYRAYVGRRQIEHDTVAPELVKRFAAATDQAFPADDGALPPMWHYGLFATETPTAGLGPDGHPPRGDFMPPVSLPRRMFAGAGLRFHSPLLIGQPATKVTEISSVDFRDGKSGALVFVRLNIRYLRGETLCIEEEQTIVYRNDGPPIAAVVPSANLATPESDASEDWQPNSVALFRFSAVTFNAHRIHYDRPYATGVEGYPALVVHGPFTAFKLCNFAGRLLQPLKAFRFRGEAPLFVDQPVRLTTKKNGAEWQLKAIRCDGVVAMSATAA
jgi:3-methylfumaryl-CoA hydratase